MHARLCNGVGIPPGWLRLAMACTKDRYNRYMQINENIQYVLQTNLLTTFPDHETHTFAYDSITKFTLFFV